MKNNRSDRNEIKASYGDCLNRRQHINLATLRIR